MMKKGNGSLISLSIFAAVFFALAKIAVIHAQSINMENKGFGSERAIPGSVAEAAQAITEAYQPNTNGDSLDKFEGELIPGRTGDIFRPFKENYAVTMEIASLSKPQSGSKTPDNFQSRLVVGLRNPYYQIKDDIRVIGTFDFRFENSIYGISNIAKITLKYDLQRYLPKGSARMNFNIDTVALKFGIPF